MSKNLFFIFAPGLKKRILHKINRAKREIAHKIKLSQKVKLDIKYMSSFNEWINKNKRILWLAILLAGAKAWCDVPET